MTISRFIATASFALASIILTILIISSGTLAADAAVVDDVVAPPTGADESAVASDDADPRVTRPIVVDDAFLERCARVAAYSDRHDGRSVLVMHRGEIVFERYAEGVTERSHFELASGTKSFIGVLAMAAVADGLLDLEERASDTLVEWSEDPTKRDITIRQILTLTSGIGSGTVGRPPAYADAIAQPRQSATGTAFIYGPAPFQVFGEILRRKLVASGSEGGVAAYARARLFDPIGITIGAWRIGRDGNPHLPSGIALTARDWAKFGEFVRNLGAVGDTQIVPADSIAACMRGTPIKPEYGLTWWMAWFDGQGLDPEEVLQSGNTRGTEPRDADIWMAAGLGKQRLYVIPSMELVIVRQAGLSRRGGFSDQAFLTMLLELEPADKLETERPRRPLRDRLRGRSPAASPPARR